MSRRRQNYKQHVVEATSYLINDGQGGYGVHFDIENHTNTKHVDVTHFESPQRFKSDDDALTAGIQLGRQKVDAGYVVGTPVVND